MMVSSLIHWLRAFWGHADLEDSTGYIRAVPDLVVVLVHLCNKVGQDFQVMYRYRGLVVV